ncbi:hypothetical protein FA15DRAFT_666465 [Coprinopsis marcescibilis]|uniref:Uncharacterized protein n=1 Tax=Coprinopsis marcescibilis TaxID=230819 RepID=A0A5C3L3H3_COPMA|nr:hypothetical protein FA15DRAFT_666465 [Coprinopsis marcescibilis]
MDGGPRSIRTMVLYNLDGILDSTHLIFPRLTKYIWAGTRVVNSFDFKNNCNLANIKFSVLKLLGDSMVPFVEAIGVNLETALQPALEVMDVLIFFAEASELKSILDPVRWISVNSAFRNHSTNLQAFRTVRLSLVCLRSDIENDGPSMSICQQA